MKHGFGHRCAWRIPYFLPLMTLAAMTLAAALARGDESLGEPLIDRRIAAHVEAGEFAPAVRLAEATADPAEHDVRLARIAAAQRSTGAATAAVATAGRIRDDQLRSDAYAASSPGGHTAEAIGGFGGGQEVDFDAVMELIKSTVAPDTWSDVGGAGSVKGFANGVYVDAEGVLHKLAKTADAGGALATLRAEAQRPRSDLADGDVQRVSRLRKVSLPRLERAIAERAALGMSPDEAMRQLAGLSKIEYVFVYPGGDNSNGGDIVLAGPAGPWKTDVENRVVSAESGRPVVRLDDLVVVLRHVLSRGASEGKGGVFGCSITPTEDGLAATRRFAEESGRKKLPAGDAARDEWLAGLRSALGRQKIDVFGIDPKSRVAQVLVEADFRMKLVGLGLEEGVLGVPSYLSSVRVGTDGRLPPLDVLRWWFTLDYDAIEATADRSAFAIKGRGVRLLSENQFLEATGKRQTTGESSPANGEFAHNFTEHFGELATKYPVYAELQNLCDAALVAALIESENLDDAVGWSMAWLGDERRFVVAAGNAPQTVETVAAHRVIGDKHVVAAVSGGVRIEPAKFAARDRIRASKNEALAGERKSSQPPANAAERWWWD
ncbi:MAG: DUF1598 domain-containing protein [Pirellulales bacterium]